MGEAGGYWCSSRWDGGAAPAWLCVLLSTVRLLLYKLSNLFSISFAYQYSNEVSSPQCMTNTFFFHFFRSSSSNGKQKTNDNTYFSVVHTSARQSWSFRSSPPKFPNASRGGKNSSKHTHLCSSTFGAWLMLSLLFVGFQSDGCNSVERTRLRTVIFIQMQLFSELPSLRSNWK